ncbi:hypothetical protein [Methylobacterium oxalidis]|uniref:Uncharacterized protein n=1 Tax=Methylobacterium oxalidis TaxID=944322 RepID=A0A512J9A1_9HYPH|nr:hypothetical protein [Methylobacterium oxalidis]GEP06537.1 hypothetical protein MOX02_45750 [Methylobacterium oxalidis]GJE30733.1 hypothetical protein LDDCCGHA_0902 [Methylobacterium oxalidis]GLS63885.1 hypothetical protein GCM10007888_22660 [Methylobacterium oxalidis]
MSVPPKQFVDLSEEAALAMACAAHGASRAIEEATGSAPDPELSQKVALFAIGAFISCGGLGLKHADHKAITTWLAQDVAAGGGG